MATPLVIVGMGGFGREVHDLIEDINGQPGYSSERFEVLGYLDDARSDFALQGERELTHLGSVSDVVRLQPGVQYVIAVGSASVRRRVDDLATAAGCSAATLVHPSAVVGRRRVSIAPGVIICAMTTITTNVTLGRHVHLNMGVTVGHDAACGSYVTVSPNASISGNVNLEEEAFVGTGAVILQGRRVGARAVVGAGAAVMQDVSADATVIGVPARPLPTRSGSR